MIERSRSEENELSLSLPRWMYQFFAAARSVYLGIAVVISTVCSRMFLCYCCVSAAFNVDAVGLKVAKVLCIALYYVILLALPACIRSFECYRSAVSCFFLRLYRIYC